MSSHSNYHHQQQELFPTPSENQSNQNQGQGSAQPIPSGVPSSTQGPLNLQAQSGDLHLPTAYASSSSSTSSSNASTSRINPYSEGSGRHHYISNPTQLYHVTAGRSTSLPNAQRSQQGILNLIDSLQFQVPFSSENQPSYSTSTNMNQDRSTHTLHRGASAESVHGFQCPNCSKSFARDDLLRRHLTREARAQAQPTIDRQKSCYECARSKSRCDLEVPSCGRCRSRGKDCIYGARSGNPNVRKSLRETQEPGGEGSSNWGGTPSMGTNSQWTGAGSPGYSSQSMKEGRSSMDEYESDDSRNWQDSFQEYRAGRATSTSSASTSESVNAQRPQQQQHHSFESGYSQNYNVGNRSHSPIHFTSTFGSTQTGAQLARGFARTGISGSIDTNVNSSSGLGLHDEEGEVTPINRTSNNSLGSESTMGPPQITPTRYRDASMNFTSPYWDPSPGAMHPYRQSSTGEMQRPQPPRLLTGAKMPNPPGRSGAEPVSGRPLFSAQLDLSCWLEEPVIPSPLYRMGPSLSALAPNTPTRNILVSPLNTGATAETLRSALATNMPLPVMTSSDHSSTPSSSDTVMEQQNNKDANVETQVAARQWWAHALSVPQSDVQIQSVAQACAGHFTIYPALMVLPDPTSPVPPLFHRPWLASSREQTPSSLARSRVLLAAYSVKLPSSESMVWEMIATEANTIVASFDQHMNASDLEVYSSTAALWFLVILLLMSSDPNSGAKIPTSLVDSSLIGLSHFSRLLSRRIEACEERRKSQESTPSFLEWGFEETMKRTLFASYSLLVLQRFRETSTEIQSQLAGIDLIINIPLPAPAMEFEAGNEVEWRASQHVQTAESVPDGHLITIQDLLNARKGEDGAGQISKEITSYFDRHDDFTNVCLSVAFALDRSVS